MGMLQQIRARFINQAIRMSIFIRPGHVLSAFLIKLTKLSTILHTRNSPIIHLMSALLSAFLLYEKIDWRWVAQLAGTNLFSHLEHFLSISLNFAAMMNSNLKATIDHTTSTYAYGCDNNRSQERFMATRTVTSLTRPSQ